MDYMEERQWKSGSDVLARFRTQPAAKTLTRFDLRGKVEIDQQPVEDVEYSFRGVGLHVNVKREAREQWIPPSEDPFYKAKWAFYKALFSTGE